MKPNHISAALCLIFGLSACATDTAQQQQPKSASTPPQTIPNIPVQAPLVPAIPSRLTTSTATAYMNSMHKEIEQALAGNTAVEMERLAENVIKLTAGNEVSFDFNQSTVKPDFLATLDRLIAPMQRFNLTSLTVVGHTDSTGDATYNQNLSFRRAESVSNHLLNAGIPTGRLSTEGRGESEPRISNATEAGRQLNRRVEILIKPIVNE